MSGKWAPHDLDDFVRQYESGVSENALAKTYGVSRNVIARVLRENGVERRDSAAANRILVAGRTPEENKRFALAAQSARRGNRDPIERLMRRAQTREQRRIGVSPAENVLELLLRERGYEAVAQKAIGPYNVDLAVESVAVEIYGGGWHASGRHRRREAKRSKHILDAGWAMLVVWVERRSHGLTAGGVDEIVAFVEETRRDPSLRGQYRVIWGDGKPRPGYRLNVD